jgi:uncharacterized protein (DUF111 family)
MTVAYFDCSRGISGGAALAALVDAGADIDALSKELGFLGGDDPILTTAEVVRGPFRVRTVAVADGETRVGGGLGDLESLLGTGRLPDRARDLALRVNARLAEAEARVHGSSPEAVRFHEVGSRRSVVGVVGTALALAHLGVDTVAASPMPFGHGSVDTAHGRLAVPTPATLELLRGVPVEPQDEPGELVTPTGVAILVGAGATFGGAPAMTVDGVGYGAGDLGRTQIVVRVVLGR